jgi:parallel beta-helix repeat protein
MIEILPESDIQSAVDAAPPGSSFLLKSGVHRSRIVSPKDGNTFTGETGAVVNGSTVLTGWKKDGKRWVTSCPPAGPTHGGMCVAGFPRCDHPEELFYDHARLRHVGSLSEVTSGTWFFDGPRIYLGSNPTGHLVELSTLAAFMRPTANHVTLTHLVVEKYASPAQHGAIEAQIDETHLTDGWTVRGCEIRLCHGGAIRTGDRMTIAGCSIHHQGQIGIVGAGDRITVTNTEIAWNNQAGFDYHWEAGGTKFVRTTHLLVRRCYVHHNTGPGIWTDTDNADSVIERNIVEDNACIGIFHEISWACVIRDNIVRRCGLDYLAYGWGAGILCASSSDVEICGNLVEDCGDGIIGVQQPRGSGVFGQYAVARLDVHHNLVKTRQGWTGLLVSSGDTSVFVSSQNRFNGNTYTLGPAACFTWDNRGDVTWSQWNRYGQDTEGLMSA